MTGTSLWMNQVLHFDQYFTKNYNKIRNEAVSITQHYQYSDDIVNNVYLKIKHRIWLSGYTGDNVHGYIWQSILNEWRAVCNLNKKRKSEELVIANDIEGNNGSDYNSCGYKPEVEKKLQEMDHWNKSQEEYYEAVEFAVYVMFTYVESKYDDKASTLFKRYFLVEDKYKDLHKGTGYSMGYISKTMKIIRKDLKQNFQTYFRNYVQRRSN